MSTNHIPAQDRVAPAADQVLTGPVTLMNSFAVRPDRDEAFHELWAKTAKYFTAQPGFVSLRLHRAVTTDAQYRWVNVANWESEAHFRAAHGTDEFRRVVTPARLGGVPQLAGALPGHHRSGLAVRPNQLNRCAAPAHGLGAPYAAAGSLGRAPFRSPADGKRAARG